MKVIPAVDLRGGKCVQLVQGKKGSEAVVLDDPVSVAKSWQDRGASLLHVVDLDAAFGDGDNRDIIAAIIDALSIPVQVGGGIRSTAAVEAMLDVGASRVVVGTRAVRDPAWLAETAARFPDTLIVAVDAQRYDIVTTGWTEKTGMNVIDFARSIDGLPLAALLYTNVAVEGMMKGIELKPVSELISAVSLPVIISGGVSTNGDLKTLASYGAWGAVVGMALYTGAITLSAAGE